jgi:DNA-binding GntR family transcriptional regulator
MSSFVQIKAVSLRERVVAQVRSAIIEGRLKPGDHIVEGTLTRQLGVSRTPVREALILLEREGLVHSEPHKGSFVRAFDEADVAAIFSMRTTLENFAAERALSALAEKDMRHLDDLMAQQERAIREGQFGQVRAKDMAFHAYLVSRAEHPLLERAWGELVAQVAALLYVRAEAIPAYDETNALREHRAILDAFQAGDLGGVWALNERINGRVAAECQLGVRSLRR